MPKYNVITIYKETLSSNSGRVNIITKSTFVDGRAVILRIMCEKLAEKLETFNLQAFVETYRQLS